MHTPVLLQEVLEALEIKKNSLYIDATVGEGGHALKIAELGGKVLGIDIDLEQVQSLKFKIQSLRNIRIVQGNYKDIERIAKKRGFFPVDGVLFDLGLSMRQIRKSGRGFSYNRPDEELDMRLADEEKSKAKDFLNSLDEDSLYEIFARFSEELGSRSIARAIVRSRSLKRIDKVGDLTETIDQAIGRKDEKVYGRIFQSLRIAVNSEFKNMKKGIEGAYSLLRKNGRIAVITFHSLEDRLIKRIIQEHEWLSEKPVINQSGASYERSAKLRVIIKNEKYN